MPDETPARRWDDVKNEIGAAVRNAALEFRLTLDRIDRDVQQLKTTMYGNPAFRQVGVVDRLDQIEGHMTELGKKIDQLIDASQARDNQFLGAKKAFYVLAAIAAALGGPPAIASLLKAFGISP